MSLPSKNTLKKAFITAVAGATLTGCAVVPYGPDYGGYRPHGYYEPAPVIIVPEHHRRYEPRFEPRHDHPRFEPRPFHPRHR